MRNINTIIVIGVFSAIAAVAQAQARPNFVLFIADDVSADDFGCYGHPTIQTPSIDALASDGLRFTNAYLTTSSCSPTRCSIITGRYPHNTGASELHRMLPDDQVRFPQLLKEAGYYTVLSGKNHGMSDTEPAFNKITDGGGPGYEEDWVSLVENRPKDQPFFFWFAAVDAHRLWQVNDKAPTYDPDDVVVPPYMTDDADTREDLTNYYHEVSRFDYYVGQVVESLEKQGVMGETVIIVIADNGRPFTRAKTRLYDSGIKTPMVIRYPSVVPTGQTTDGLVSVIDISATVLELAGLDKPKAVQGVSFLPVLNDPSVAVRDVAFAEHNWHCYQAHERMVRFDDFLYIKNNYPDKSVQAGGDLVAWYETGQLTPRPTKTYPPSPAEELYVVSEDKDQLNNVADDPRYADTITRARELLAIWTKQTGDSVPSDPTPDRDPSSEIRNPFREQPGESHGASKLLHPGPIRLNE
jgi:N-sulfoglucosamine sulfohydrolase